MSEQLNDQNKAELIRRTVARGATDDEFRTFLLIAQRAGLDPLLGQVQFVKRKRKDEHGNYIEVGQTLFGRDSYRIVADRTGHLDGISVEPQFDDKRLVSATATVWRKDRTHPFVVTVYLAEYADAERSFLWKSKPITMLCKVAEAQALRMAFPDLLTGSYIPEEIEQAGTIEPPMVRVQTASAGSPASGAGQPQSVPPGLHSDDEPELPEDQPDTTGVESAAASSSTGSKLPVENPGPWWAKDKREMAELWAWYKNQVGLEEAGVRELLKAIYGVEHHGELSMKLTKDAHKAGVLGRVQPKPPEIQK